MGDTANDDLRDFAARMEANAEARDETDPMQDKLAALEEHWAAELRELIEAEQ